jgi:hypothetical protein
VQVAVQEHPRRLRREQGLAPGKSPFHIRWAYHLSDLRVGDPAPDPSEEPFALGAQVTRDVGWHRGCVQRLEQTAQSRAAGRGVSSLALVPGSISSSRTTPAATSAASTAGTLPLVPNAVSIATCSDTTGRSGLSFSTAREPSDRVQPSAIELAPAGSGSPSVSDQRSAISLASAGTLAHQPATPAPNLRVKRRVISPVSTVAD